MTVFEKKESDQTTKLLVRVVLFLCKVASEGTDTESERSRQSKKCTPTRQLLAELPSFSLHPRHDSTWAMTLKQGCGGCRDRSEFKNRTDVLWPGPIGQDTSQLHRHEQTAASKAWRAEVPAGEDEKEEGREAVAAVRDQLRLQSDSPVWGTSCGAHRQARGAVAGAASLEPQTKRLSST